MIVKWTPYWYGLEAAILGISHPILGAITGILTEGLDYSFLLGTGNVLRVNAEEEPGTVGNETFTVADWSVDVDLEILQKTKHSS